MKEHGNAQHEIEWGRNGDAKLTLNFSVPTELQLHPLDPVSTTDGIVRKPFWSPASDLILPRYSAALITAEEQRFLVLHRFWRDNRSHKHRQITVATDGEEVEFRRRGVRELHGLRIDLDFV